jgi:hypothetical protein
MHSLRRRAGSGGLVTTLRFDGPETAVLRQGRVNCTKLRPVTTVPVGAYFRFGVWLLMDIRRALADGRARVPRVGAVVKGSSVVLPWRVLDRMGQELTPVSEFLRDVDSETPAL